MDKSHPAPFMCLGAKKVLAVGVWSIPELSGKKSVL